MAGLIQNVTQGNLEVVPFAPHYFDDDREQFFQDITVLTGARFFSKYDDLRTRFEGIKETDLGRAEISEVYSDKLVIVGGMGTKESIEAHTNKIKTAMEGNIPEEALIKLQQRLERFSSSVAQITLGGYTEAEIKERKFRLEDALNAVQATIHYGYTIGGAKVYVHYAEKYCKTSHDPFKRMAYHVIYSAFKAVFERLTHENFEVGMFSSFEEGIELKTGKVTNLEEFGIIEPAGIFRNVLNNGMGIVSLLVNTGGIILPDDTYRMD
jgi:chaperonin GroEL